MTELARIDDVHYSPTALELRPGLTFARWAELGQLLARIRGSLPWLIGDWINFGEHAYGEKYAQALDATGLDYSTVATYAWVARQVEPSRRRETLSWTSHRELASLPPAEQESWLDRAEADGLGSRDLRRELRALRAPAELDTITVTAPRSSVTAWTRKAAGRPLAEVAIELSTGGLPMPRESIEEKARRYLAEGRLHILHVNAHAIEATCQDDTAYRLGWDGRQWSCTCPARRTCCHLRALMLATVKTPQTATSVSETRMAV